MARRFVKPTHDIEISQLLRNIARKSALINFVKTFFIIDPYKATSYTTIHRLYEKYVKEPTMEWCQIGLAVSKLAIDGYRLHDYLAKDCTCECYVKGIFPKPEYYKYAVHEDYGTTPHPYIKPSEYESLLPHIRGTYHGGYHSVRVR